MTPLTINDITEEVQSIFDLLSANKIEELIKDGRAGPSTAEEYLEPIRSITESEKIYAPFVYSIGNIEIYNASLPNKIRIEADIEINKNKTDLTAIFYARNGEHPYGIYLYDLRVL